MKNFDCKECGGRGFHTYGPDTEDCGVCQGKGFLTPEEHNAIFLSKLFGMMDAESFSQRLELHGEILHLYNDVTNRIDDLVHGGALIK